MKLLLPAFIWILMGGSALAGTFFSELEQAYLKACEEIVKVRGTNAFSVCLTYEDRIPNPSASPFQALPAGFWDKLRDRLEAKGLNLSAYVPCEKLRWSDSHQVVRKDTAGRASLYVIDGFKWGGDDRLFLSWKRRFAPLAEEGGTLILKLKEGRWIMVGTAGGWVS